MRIANDKPKKTGPVAAVAKLNNTGHTSLECEALRTLQPAKLQYKQTAPGTHHQRWMLSSPTSTIASQAPLFCCPDGSCSAEQPWTRKLLRTFGGGYIYVRDAAS